MHRRDPRAKIAALLVFLVVLATARTGLLWLSAGFFLLLAAGLVWARLPVIAVLGRAAVVLPFTLVFVLVCWIGGDPGRGLSLAVKSYLSAVAVLLVISTTPLPALLRGLESAGVPSFLLLVVQFLYRYLFVIAEEAQHMGKAAAARGASARQWRAGSAAFRAAAGALAVLFARAYSRAEQIHCAMLSRGFEGRFRTLEPARFRRSDAVFAVLASAAPIALRIAAERAAS